MEENETKINDNENNEETSEKISSHSSNNLIKIDGIKSFSEEENMNKSDDEFEKLQKKIKNSNKNLKGHSDEEEEEGEGEEKEKESNKEEEINKKEEEINKKDNINFDKNIKAIFNNIGKINIQKPEKEKEIDKDKENNEYELKIYKKDEQSIRKLYYSQLLLKKVWKPINDSKRHNSLIIFDWDDTLLPTSYLVPRGIFEDDIELSEKEKAKIKKLENSVQKLLSIAITKGDVFIITNAGDGWVNFSAEKYYPNILDILKKIEIISARELYENKYKDDSKKWKIETFLNLKKRVNDDLITNIICLGDSVFEMEAGRILASKFIHAVIKTIKFREKPKPEELNKQLNLVLHQFESIYTSSKNLTVRVERKKKREE